MTPKDFDKLLEKRLCEIEKILDNKAGEYASNNDRLYNFKKAAEINATTTKQALWGMASKHLVSVIDLVENRIKPTQPLIDEKIGDMINYLILLEMVLKEKL